MLLYHLIQNCVHMFLGTVKLLLVVLFLSLSYCLEFSEKKNCFDFDFLPTDVYSQLCNSLRDAIMVFFISKKTAQSTYKLEAIVPASLSFIVRGLCSLLLQTGSIIPLEIFVK